MSGTVHVADTHWRRRRTLYLVLLVCLAPVVASYLAYYVMPPGGRTNYGELVAPQRPVPPLQLRQLDGTPFELASLRGRWVLLHVDAAQCADSCQRKLWKMRQVRLTTGKERERVERVFLVIDTAPLETMLLREYEGTRFLRANLTELGLLLQAKDAIELADPIWVVDPLGHLMMRWPRDADPSRMKRDLDRLLRASRVG